MLNIFMPWHTLDADNVGRDGRKEGKELRTVL